jgi:threonine dehydratase
MTEFPVTLREVQLAAARAAGVVRHTPLLGSGTFSTMAGCSVYLKAENLQVAGSFKIRGAVNKMASLSPEQRAAGVVAASMGNHAQGVAYAATHFGIRSTIVMPLVAPLSKLQATEGYGARVVRHGETLDQCVAEAERIARETGAILVHPYDDWEVIAGQGTLGLEILQDLPEADVLVVPLGGGGLLAGIALAVKELRPAVRVIGVQAAGCAAYPAALAAGEPVLLTQASTIADGIRVRQPGARPFAVVRALVDDVVTVEDEAIILTIMALLERRKLVVEGAGAAGLAALIHGGLRLPPAARVVTVLCGGNIDLSLVGHIISYSLAASGRLLTVEVTVADTPNQLGRVLGILGSLGANIDQVAHFRGEMAVPVGSTTIRISMETYDAAHQQAIMAALREHGYTVRRLGPGTAV